MPSRRLSEEAYTFLAGKTYRAYVHVTSRPKRPIAVPGELIAFTPERPTSLDERLAAMAAGLRLHAFLAHALECEPTGLGEAIVRRSGNPTGPKKPIYFLSDLLLY